MNVILINGISSARPKENAPHEAGHYLSLVARGGIDQGRGCQSYIRQGQSKVLLLTPTSGS
jgi:hypothetical protein